MSHSRSMLTPVDMEILRKMAKGAGVDERKDGWWWNRLFTSKDFVEQLHVSLYGLILGILDDVFAELKIHVLSDTINLDLVAAKEPTIPKSEPEDTAIESSSAPASSSAVSVGSFAAATFAAGVGVGVSLMAVISNSSN